MCAREVCQGQPHAGRKGNVPLVHFLFSLSLSLCLSKAYITSIRHPAFSDVPQTSVLQSSAINSFGETVSSWKYLSLIVLMILTWMFNAAAIPCSPTVQALRVLLHMCMIYGDMMAFNNTELHSWLTTASDISSLSSGTWPPSLGAPQFFIFSAELYSHSHTGFHSGLYI